MFMPNLAINSACTSVLYSTKSFDPLHVGSIGVACKSARGEFRQPLERLRGWRELMCSAGIKLVGSFPIIDRVSG